MSQQVPCFIILCYASSTIAAFAIAIPMFQASKSEDIDSFNGLSGKKESIGGSGYECGHVGLGRYTPICRIFG